MAIPESTLPGHHLLHERVVAALQVCQESTDIDFKESAEWSSLKNQIARTAIAMANLRDGGIIVIGVGERGGVWSLDEVDANHLATYDTDTANDFVNRYAFSPDTS